MSNPTGDRKDDLLQDHHGSFLLTAFDVVTHAWVTQLSLVAIPPLRPKANTTPQRHQFNRDIFVCVMFCASLGTVALCYLLVPTHSNFLLHALAASGLYRALDMFITFFRTGVYLSFRGDIQIDKEPRWRIQRIILAMLMNYLELILWYSIIYLYMALTAQCEFDQHIKSIVDAFQLSFTTMTTIGCGRYNPIGLFANAMAFAQVATGIILLALAVSSMLVMLTKDPPEQVKATSRTLEEPTWRGPLVAFAVIATGLFFLLAARSCP